MEVVGVDFMANSNLLNNETFLRKVCSLIVAFFFGGVGLNPH
jgi:hypothetical protein